MGIIAEVRIFHSRKLEPSSLGKFDIATLTIIWIIIRIVVWIINVIIRSLSRRKLLHLT